MKYTEGSVQAVLLSDINPDPAGIQPRETLVSQKVQEYAEAYKEGVEMPHIEVWQIGDDPMLRIIDGYHREAALRSSKSSTKIRAIVRSGTMVEAKERAIKLNVTHGISLTPHERERALMAVFDAVRDEGEEINERETARSTGMSRGTIRKYHQKWQAVNGGAAPKGSVDSFDIDDTPQSAAGGQNQGQGGTRVPPSDDIPPFEDPPAPSETESRAVAEAILHDSQQAFAQLDQHFIDARRKIRDIGELEGGEHLKRHENALVSTIEQCLSVVRSCRPTAVCPSCGGEGGDCAVCKGFRVIVREQKRAMDEDAKARK